MIKPRPPHKISHDPSKKDADVIHYKQEENIKRATLAEINQMYKDGLLYHNPDAPVGPPPEYMEYTNDSMVTDKHST